MPTAQTALNEAITADPSDPEPFLVRARGFRMRRQFREAAEALDEASRREPKNPEILLSLLQTRQLAGDESRTEELGERVVALSPNDPKALVALGSYFASLPPEQDKRERARALLENAVRLAPTMPIPSIELGRLLMSEGKNLLAEQYLASAWEMLHRGMRPLRQLEAMGEVEKRRAETAYALFRVLKAQGKQKEAAQWMVLYKKVDARIEERSRLSFRAYAERPEVAAIVRLARLDIQTGGAEEAVGLIRRGLAIAPDNRDLRAIAEQLRSMPAEAP
jgi:tetratricopeptide (TPR) repeat protein